MHARKTPCWTLLPHKWMMVPRPGVTTSYPGLGKEHCLLEPPYTFDGKNISYGGLLDGLETWRSCAVFAPSPPCAQSGSIDSKEDSVYTLQCWLADQPVMNWAIFNVRACILYCYWWVCVPAIVMEITVHAAAWLNSSTSRLRDVGYKKENE